MPITAQKSSQWEINLKLFCVMAFNSYKPHTRSFEKIISYSQIIKIGWRTILLLLLLLYSIYLV